MRVGAMVRASVMAVALPAVIGAGCSGGDGTAVVRVTGLEFGIAPGSVTAGVPFSVTVELLGSNGDVASGATDQVTLTLLNPGTAVLNGATTVAAIDGIATFNGLSINVVGIGLQLHASITGFATQSATFTVARGAVSVGQSSVLPAPGNVPLDAAAILTFTFKDAFGNVAANAPVSFTSSLAGSSFTPASGTTNASGAIVTSFTSSTEGSATVAAVVDGVTISAAAPYVVVDGLCPADPVPMAFPGTVNGALPCGNYIATAFSPAFYAFTSAGGGAQFTLNSTYATGILVAPSLGHPTVIVPFAAGGQTREWLLPAGDYVAAVLPDAPIAGPFALVTVSSAGNTGAVLRFLVASGTYAGQSIANTDRLDAYETGEQWYADDYVFYSPGPCTLTMQAPSFGAYLEVYGTSTPGGSVVVETAPGVDAVISLTTCRGTEGGPVGIYVSSTAQLATGAYTLILAAPQGGVGASLRASLSGAGAAEIPLPTFGPSTLPVYSGQPRAARRR